MRRYVSYKPIVKYEEKNGFLRPVNVLRKNAFS